MSKPWFPLYIGDFIAHTAHLSAAEVGAFSLLLSHCMYHGHLPDEPERLARIAKMSRKEWDESSLFVLELFTRKLPIDGLTAVQHILGIGRVENRPPLSKADREYVLEAFKGQCAYCGGNEGPFEIDHVVPYSRGGSHSRENFALACVPCNRSKGARMLAEWAP